MAMKARGSGVIINIIDICTDRPYPAYLPYAVSKAGLAALTRGLARVLAPEVRVNGVSPGTVLWPEDYPEEQKQATIDRTPLRRIGKPEDIAAAVLFLVEGSDFLTGAIIPVGGGRDLV
jgi:pteridine reductase